MNKEQIDLLLDLYETKNVSVTAKRLNHTIQNIYYQINAIEKKLGTKIINIGKKNNDHFFTEKGEAIIDQFQIIKNCYNNIEHICQDNPVRIGVKPYLSALAANILISSFPKDNRPFCFTEIDIEPSTKKFDYLTNNVVDIVPGYEGDCDYFDFIPLLKDDYYIICDKSMFIGKNHIYPESLLSLNLIIGSHEKPLRSCIKKYMIQNNLCINIVEVNTLNSSLFTSYVNENTVILTHSNYLHYVPFFLKAIKIDGLFDYYGIFIRKHTTEIDNLAAKFQNLANNYYIKLVDDLLKKQ